MLYRKSNYCKLSDFYYYYLFIFFFIELPGILVIAGQTAAVQKSTSDMVNLVMCLWFSVPSMVFQSFRDKLHQFVPKLLKCHWKSAALQKRKIYRILWVICVLEYMRTAKAQIRLRGCTVWSGPSLSGYYRMYQWRTNARMSLCMRGMNLNLCILRMFKDACLLHVAHLFSNFKEALWSPLVSLNQAQRNHLEWAWVGTAKNYIETFSPKPTKF